ncbi:chorion peroxidase-like [Daphnia carinata]|uniref:chorion peroxidase-like n=1 Tax=Daphnia carinata TaxID=120202 RepID=UPI002580F624|nr:chorion peroxidase-like [Daphnia carinata]
MAFAIRFVILFTLSFETLADSFQHNLSKEDLEEGLQVGRQYARDVEALEEAMNHTLIREEIFSGFDPFAIPDDVKQSKEASIELTARQYLSSKFDVPANEIRFDDITERKLQPLSKCDPSYPYRSFDGTCNNLENPRYGEANTIFQRLMGPATYSDGVSTIRVSESEAALASPRLVTTSVTVNKSVSESQATLLTMQWGQFLDHDLTFTAIAKTSSGGAILCRCSDVSLGLAHPECLPITVPIDDAVYSSQNITCIHTVRSSFGLNLDDTTPTSREQINSLTHWMDGSQIYGNNDEVARSLRDTTSGKGLMKVSMKNGRELMPLSPTCCPNDPTNTCPAAQSCFMAGDPRATVQPLLAVMHTLWLREHNRVAKLLYDIYGSDKTDEFYYQQARRIVIAEFQHITYKEYLPVLLGPLASLHPPSNGPSNPAIFNEFVAAAYRMGHSQLRSFIRLYEADGSESSQSFLLGNSFITGGTRLLHPTFVDNALRGLLRTQAQSVDENFAEDITSLLFRPDPNELGADLVSINIQRGRDHGLPPYVIARNIAQVKLFNNGASCPSSNTTFDDLKSTTSEEVIASFKKLYGSPKDIDLYIGGVTEKHVPGALIGPTFGYIIATQFENLKRSDRFFYSDVTKNISFNSAQLGEIEKSSLARIICDNGDGSITSIQPNAFRIPTGSNTPFPCSDIPGINFHTFEGIQSVTGRTEEL